MVSIGPQLPPHLQKRKRTPDDDANASKASPPAKMSRQGNDDEISREDDSDDGFGPSAPTSTGRSIGPSLPPSASSQTAKAPTPAPASRSIGPSLPPPTTATNEDEIALNSDSDSDVGPAPPRAAVGPTMAPPPRPPQTTKRVLGPSPPLANLSERPTTGPDSDSDSDSDDGWGPALPSETFNNNQLRPVSISQIEINPAVPKRDDWMIAPPTENTNRAPPDPTKLKNRKFAGGPRGGTEKSTGVSSIWTETPEQKLQRLTNAVLGRDDPSAAQSAPAGPSRSDARKVDEERIKEFTEKTRGRSLVEQHKAAKAAGKAKAGDGGGKWGGEDEEDDPSKRAFDREKDMAVGGKLSNVKKKEIMNRAADFGGRFQKGSYL